VEIPSRLLKNGYFCIRHHFDDSIVPGDV